MNVKMRKIILCNIKEIFKVSVKISAAIFTVLSILLSVKAWDEIMLFRQTGRMTIFALVPFVGSLLACLWVCILKKENIIFEKGTNRVDICYGDIMKTGFPARKAENRIVVIPVNTNFDTIVDQDITKHDKPLVSSRTMHGKWILRMEEEGIDGKMLQMKIEESLTKRGIEPVGEPGVREKERGNPGQYAIGTTAAIRGGRNITFLLVAMSEFDENNNAVSAKENVMNCAESVLDFYYKCGQGYDLFLPLMGTGMSGAGLGAKDSAEILKAFFRLHADRVRGRIHIVIYKGDKDKVSVFD